jgi:cation:H+ antiporter
MFAYSDVLALVAAIPLAALGGEAFLKGTLGVADWLRLPKLLVATTLAAFATSSPELTVSSMAALVGKPEIGLGDALGSNVVNIGLILGLALLFGALTANFAKIRRDFMFALGVPALTMMLALDGALSGTDGALLLAVFTLWLALAVRQARQHRRQQAENAATCPRLAVAVRGSGLPGCGWAPVCFRRIRHGCHTRHPRLHHRRTGGGYRHLAAGAGHDPACTAAWAR